jgi:putative copper export protein/methionine-rich copper-binding protein CopC
MAGIRLLLAALAAAFALLATLVAPALPGAAGTRVLAHAQLVASSPGAGATVDASPDEIRLIFSEPLEQQGTSLDVLDINGEPVLTRVGDVDAADQFALVVADPGLPDGVYRVNWRTLSQADGHTIEGFFNFGVGDVPGSLAGGPSGSTHAGAEPIDVVGRWLTYIGLLLALGLATFHRIVVRDQTMPRRLVRALAGALALSALATLAIALASGIDTPSVVEYLFGSRNGLLHVARTVVAALGAAGLWFARPRLAVPIAAATGFAGIVLLIAAGHASALRGIAPIINGVVHVSGAAVWIGGIVALLLLARRPEWILGSGQRPRMRELVPRFSALALASIGLVVTTGVYAAWTQTGALVTAETEYGRTLIMKAGFAAGALALGTLNFLDGGRMMRWLDGFRSRITVEVMLAATVVALTGALAATPPHVQPPGVAIEPIPDAFGEVAPGMEMTVTPGRPGVNRIVVTTIDALAGSAALELALDNLEEGTSSRVPLTLQAMTGMVHSSGGLGQAHTTESGRVDWTADALVLPPESAWDSSVLILAQDGTELSRQRFAFALDEHGIADGQLRSLLDPALAVGVALALGGAVGLGLGIGGWSLPRCEAVASRVALLGGGSVGIVLGSLIGVSVLLA